MDRCAFNCCTTLNVGVSIHWTGLLDCEMRGQRSSPTYVRMRIKEARDLVPLRSAMAEFDAFCHEVRSLSIRTLV